jgi:ATP-dependent DNA helicase RecG
VIELVWFQGAKWIKQSLKFGKEYIVFGKPAEFNRSYNIVHPSLDEPEDAANKMYLHIQPFYNVSEKMKARGLDSKALMKLLNQLISDSRFDVEETLPDYLIKNETLLDRRQSLINIHFPESLAKLNEAQKRLKFEELFYAQLKILRFKQNRTQLYNGIQLTSIGDYFNTFYNTKLPFELTNAQKRVIKEIRADVKSGKQMNRLVQGDVGSGKTVVALMSMLIALDNSYQACMMAPTEILATQHYQSLTQLLDGMDIKVHLLTGSTKAKQRRQIHEDLMNGSCHILVGTHALIESSVQFKNLGIAVIDEQHRFGVEQRSKLWHKNTYPPHVLVMTATPIPRTLAMTLYGDLDTSVIDEMPAGRKPIQTIHKYDSHRLAVYGFMRSEIAKGRQVYIVYPLIEESEKMTYKNLTDGFEQICREFQQPQYHVSMVHGKMKAADKDTEMKMFIKGITHIMVATTVIEVGVNVPNASVMVIESAEKFGLSQLHQLRGRVGRGADQSYCLLLTDFKLSNDARQRIKTMVETNDGFKISEVDLQLRGPGDIEGTIQSGILNMRIADISKDNALLMEARQKVIDILEKDPKLENPENIVLNSYFELYNKTSRWGSIS